MNITIMIIIRSVSIRENTFDDKHSYPLPETHVDNTSYIHPESGPLSRASFQYQDRLIRYEFPIINIIGSQDSLIFIMGIPIPNKTRLDTEWPPGDHFTNDFSIIIQIWWKFIFLSSYFGMNQWAMFNSMTIVVFSNSYFLLCCWKFARELFIQSALVTELRINHPSASRPGDDYHIIVSSQPFTLKYHK